MVGHAAADFTAHHHQRSGINRAVNDTQWTGLVTDTADHYVFARINQTTVALGATAELHDDAEPVACSSTPSRFVSGGDYSAYRQLVDGRNQDYGQRYAPFAYDLAVNGDPNFNVKSFRTTNVLRWEYKPGSTCSSSGSRRGERLRAGRLPCRA